MRIQIPTSYQTQYSLLRTFAEQLGAACASRGMEVGQTSDGEGMNAYLFFNHPARMEELLRTIREIPRPRAIINWCVDHPLTISAAQLDQLSQVSGYRLLMVQNDDASLLSLRFPGVVASIVAHGVDEGALVDERAIDGTHARNAEAGGRDIEVILAGSIATEEELRKFQGAIPASLHAACLGIVQTRLAHSWMSFGQAFDLCMPRGARSGDAWGLMRSVFLFTTATLNRLRRTALVKAMQGAKVVLLGNAAFGSLAGGTITYGGDVAYADLPRWLARARVCLALGPTQFVHGWSERILLSMAAGCATLADDRLGVRSDFGDCAALFDAGNPRQAKEQAAALIRDRGRCAEMGKRGRALVASRHLWSHRVAALEEIAERAGEARAIA